MIKVNGCHADIFTIRQQWFPIITLMPVIRQTTEDNMIYSWKWNIIFCWLHCFSLLPNKRATMSISCCDLLNFKLLIWNWICGTHWYMRTISLSHILFVATLFVSRYLMTYKYNSYSTNWHFVFWLTFLCYILKLTHPDNRPNHPYFLTYKHTHTHNYSMSFDL